jgi:CheY-like chemotaxis protein
MGFFNKFKSAAKDPAQITPVITKILVVDDDPLLRKYYGDILIKSNFEVITATNGQEGLTAASQVQPDLILMDIVMPIMDGNTTLKNLRENPATAHIPVIMLTSAASVKNMEETQANAADGFLNKSTVTPEEIISTIQGLLTVKSKMQKMIGS